MSADVFHNFSCLFVKKIKIKVSMFLLASKKSANNCEKNPYRLAPGGIHSLESVPGLHKCLKNTGSEMAK
jgi:hypothetical protein